MFKKNLNNQLGFLPRRLTLPHVDNPGTGNTSSSLLERRGGLGGKARFPSVILPCFEFHIIVKGIIRTRFFSLRIPVIRYHDSSGQGAYPRVWLSLKEYPYPVIILHKSNVSGKKRTFILIYTYTVDRNTKNSLENPP